MPSDINEVPRTERVCACGCGQIVTGKRTARFANDNCRKRHHEHVGHPCAWCGNRADLTSEFCWTCHVAQLNVHRDERRARIAELFCQGATYRVIADDLGSTPASVSQEVFRMRSVGYDLPLRSPGAPRKEAA